MLVGFLHFYQQSISAYRPPSCRYMPTCSQYAVESLERFGVIRGLILTVWRVLRCNPLFKGGIDRVPVSFFDAFKIKNTHK